MSRSDLSGLKEASWLGFTFEPDVSAKRAVAKTRDAFGILVRARSTFLCLKMMDSHE